MQPSPKKRSTQAASSTQPDPARVTSNLHNVRLSLASYGLHYSKPAVKQEYPDFFEMVKRHLKVDRASAMAAKSAERCINYAYTNATTGEKAYFQHLNPAVLKDNYTKVSAKRDFEGEIKRQQRSFEEDDNLISRQDVLFPSCVQPYTPGEELGLTSPKPDWLYGIRLDMNPQPDERIPGSVLPFVSFGTDMLHIFFAIENKGCEGTIEQAENQCLRTGAAMVYARCQLNKMADEATNQTIVNTTNPADASVATNQLEPTTGAATGLATPPASSSTFAAPDYDSFYFTCAWIPGMARIFVHWHENMGAGRQGILHMTRMKEFLASREEDLTELRMVGHNIFDWGIHINQKASKAALAKIVEKARIERGMRP